MISCNAQGAKISYPAMFGHTWQEFIAQQVQMTNMQTFTKDELAKYNGKDGKPIYNAHKGKIYDVTSSTLWEGGEHQGLHIAGEDMTKDISDAPHEEDVLERFPVIGTLVQ
jgi:predicted heme/steroid binding protein